MAYLALYRRYRPNGFDKLVGQEHIVKTLVNQIKGDRLGHAYLFTGTRGTGKTSAAKIFAKAINCENPVNGSPCGKCSTCVALSDPSNIDVMEIDAASNNGVNEIRDLREKVQYPPVSCKYKVYIIDEVHMLTGAAFNALLKTLEEPPKHAIFILATTEVHKIPATILSRCMRFDFRLIPIDVIAGLIMDIYDELGKRYDTEAIYAIAKAGEGSIRDALSVADTALSYNSGKLTYDDVMDILGATNADTINQLISAIIRGNSGEVLQTIDTLADLGKSMGVLIKDVTSTVRDLIVIKTCNDANSILNLPTEKYDALIEIANLTDENGLVRLLEIFSNAEGSLRYSNHPRVLFETAAIKATRPQAEYSIEAVMTRIKNLEDLVNSKTVINVASSSVTPVKTPVAKEIAVNNEEPSKEENAPNIAENTLKAEDNSDIKEQNVANLSVNEIKGKILQALRKDGAELLWNIMQTVDFNVDGNVLTISGNNVSDVEIIKATNNIARIKDALKDYNSFEIKVVQTNSSRMNDKIDEASEQVKKIFGDDIVIIK
ncbi:MAG: DNA polymerase III subunit gamma/tau [Clostridia bacterium]|nr:DNA polymerase III subunit gamma/tau [Clostridia bacterium]